MMHDACCVLKSLRGQLLPRSGCFEASRGLGQAPGGLTGTRAAQQAGLCGKRIDTLSASPRCTVPQVVELHLYRGHQIPGYELTGGDSAAKDSAQLALLLNHLAGLGYGIVAREDNTMTQDVGCCAEVTFLRVEDHVGVAAGGQRGVRRGGLLPHFRWGGGREEEPT